MRLKLSSGKLCPYDVCVPASEAKLQQKCQLPAALCSSTKLHPVSAFGKMKARCTISDHQRHQFVHVQSMNAVSAGAETAQYVSRNQKKGSQGA